MIRHLRMSSVLAIGLCLILVQTAFSQHSAAVGDTVVCRLYMDSTTAYSHRYDANDSLRYFANKVLECTEASGQRNEHMDALTVVGVTYLRESNYMEALRYFRQAEDECREVEDSLNLAKVYINIGSCYQSMDSSAKAMEILMSSAAILEHYNDSSHLLYVYTNIGALLGTIGRLDEQLEFSKKAFDMAGGKLNSRIALGLGSNLSINLLKHNMIDSSEALALRVLAESRRINYSKSLTQILNHLANISVRKEEYERALTYTDEVLTYEGSFTHNHTFGDAYNYRGAALLRMNRVDEAISSLERAWEYAGAENTVISKERVLRNLQKAYAMKGDYRKAYENLELLKLYADTLMREDNLRIVNELETKYRTEKKEQQVRELSQMNEITTLKLRQRNIWIMVLVVVALLVAGGIYFVSRQRLLKQQQEALENRLLSLRVQLNPHFIFNALTAVQNYMLGGKDLREAVRYLSNFAKVMRAFLEYNQEEKITLDKELNALELYVGIQKLRFNNGFEFDVEMDEELDPEEVLVPPMILQPLIENAIEHGIRNLDNGKITLKYELQDDHLVMRLTDNGIGRKKAGESSPKSEEKTSLATRITKERIALLNRKGEGKYALEIRDLNEDGTGTEVIFKIPLVLA
ncbi:MAG: histidine kinase [Flavobacteriales bacterium]|nr:histidine kinase [Flavobacteriales bacterium]